LKKLFLKYLSILKKNYSAYSMKHRIEHGYWGVDPTDESLFIGNNKIAGATNPLREKNAIHHTASDVSELSIVNRDNLKEFYNRSSTQMTISAVILLNGLLNIIETSHWSDRCCENNVQLQKICNRIDLGFLLFYSVELSLNFYAHFFWEFWTKTKWNWFDTIVIMVSWFPNLNVAAVRLLRTLRLVRISGRVKSFAFICDTLHKSMKGIGSLVVLLLGFVTIYAVLGVGFYKESSTKFQDFGSAIWTLFITLNGEG